MNLAKRQFFSDRTVLRPCPECGMEIKFWYVGNNPMNSHKTATGKMACENQRRANEKAEADREGNAADA